MERPYWFIERGTYGLFPRNAWSRIGQRAAGVPGGAAMIFLEQTLAILWKDIRCELRSKQTWMGMGMFALLVLVIFNFAFDLRVDNKAAIAPGALWVAFVFASLLGLGRTITAEREKGLMDRLLLCPVDRKAIYLAKLLGNMLFIGVVEIVALPIFAALFDVPLFIGALIPIVLLGTLGGASFGR